MQTDFWKQVEELFQAALAQPPEKRVQFVEDALSRKPWIRSEVQSLWLRLPSTGRRHCKGRWTGKAAI